ncbi:Lon protease family protein [Romboutsia sp. 1001216sp1]|uniref:Lon protease family protein n=1 Tax=Romboutsia sp. 1001216sp1 TaxID=2986997 RepID=UPI00232C1989|nr:ATP-binding protein [Romboutsia sp. 1001216sp1]MDB8806060.1 ATP-binding protein [Romboutsia sp. 1001216sp1]MDB8808368.1 ATP-binding protein [Romboutsia sp. 1001216sp1]MDB8811737.1 ATP-binding protein [Romboutsia sp. 1001216sp1]MDB8817357.1 ATP-binding protein [Romboutsia sp. 1001216sp1]MDB8820021.1 ATP-binding protein [Romboutsia sp. 1001216sp1]
MNIDKYKVRVEDLKPSSLIENLSFSTTEEIDSKREIIGQDRAVKAIEFGLKMKKSGYNIYVAGTNGLGRVSYTSELIKKYTSNNKQNNNRDWVYVNNFKNINEPTALSFKSGVGKIFKEDIEEIIQKLKCEVPKLFNSKEYEYHSRILMSELENSIQGIISELNEFAKPRGFKFEVTERGLVSIPIKEDGTLMQEQELGQLTPTQINKLREEGLKLNQDSKEYIDKIKNCEDDYKNKTIDLDKNVGRSLVGFYDKYLLDKYGKEEKIQRYINDLCNDIVNNIDKFKDKNEGNQQNPMALFGMMGQKNDDKFFNRYKVNLFIDNSECEDCKIIVESNPTYYNLIGCIEYKNEIGALTTSFTEVKPGALHKANGGYLIINVKDLLSNPFSWDCLKRSLKTGKISIESLNKQYGYLVTSTLKPEPIDLDVKVILIGDSRYYGLLYSYEEDFRNLFKVMADFDIEIDKNDENIYKTIQLIADTCNNEKLKHFERDAVEKVIEYSIKLSDNKDKLTARVSNIIDLVYESEAISDDSELYVTAKDVQNAIEQKVYRNNKYEEKLNEMFEDKTLLIDIEGEKVGQINGLAVMGTGEYSFGKPSKITASTYRGRHGVINIEREIKQSGSIHDKGVLILSGYLGERYGKERPLSITTSITFEQNYSGVDGDSASSTELYAIISSIADIPIKQSIAVTGSVSQKGEIQPIGGVNQKIEGFFDVCKLKGFSQKQGVMIPIQNVKNLILKDEIVEAVKAGTFSIYAISSIEEGLEILTGKTIDEIDNLVKDKLESLRQIDKKDRDDKKE